MITNYAPCNSRFSEFVIRMNTTEDDKTLAEGLHRAIVGKFFGPKCLQTAIEIINKDQNIRDALFSCLNEKMKAPRPIINLIISYSREKIVNIAVQPFFLRSFIEKGLLQRDMISRNHCNALSLVFLKCSTMANYVPHFKSLVEVLKNKKVFVELSVKLGVAEFLVVPKENLVPYPGMFLPEELCLELSTYMEQDVEFNEMKNKFNRQINKLSAKNS